jgi:hypothetical protein
MGLPIIKRHTSSSRITGAVFFIIDIAPDVVKPSPSYKTKNNLYFYKNGATIRLSIPTTRKIHLFAYFQCFDQAYSSEILMCAHYL